MITATMMDFPLTLHHVLGRAGRLGARALLPWLRRRDLAASRGPSRFLANSSFVAERIRQQPVLVGITLVAMTGYGQESDRKRSLEAGFNLHLTKPADFSQVKQILAAVSQK